MHPNTFLQTFWRLELKPQVFVAMSFAPQYQERFDKVIAPAICSIFVNGESLTPYRVDLSKSGDSILTEINDGIAHSQLVLADVSSMGKDSVTGHSYRNGNVMYEVGIALACRQPHEVLLIRDDNDKFLFDVSTIPHKHRNFADHAQAMSDLHQELLGRLREASHLNDARVQRAIAGLSGGEIGLLKYMASLAPQAAWGRENEGDVAGFVSIPRLLDKQLIRVVGQFEAGYPAYQPTPLGYVVAKLVESGLRKLKADIKSDSQQSQRLPNNRVHRSRRLGRMPMENRHRRSGDAYRSAALRMLLMTGGVVLLAKKHGIIAEKMVVMSTNHLFYDAQASYAIDFP